MIRIPQEVKDRLKRPLGKVMPEGGGFGKIAGRRVIAIGDICSLALIRAGLRPHLAVFDHKTMRKPLGKEDERELAKAYPRPKRYPNPQGMLSGRILADAPALIAGGGGVFINGEEDLTALAFILAAGKDDLVVYGQPGKGIVLVEPDGAMKKRIRRWLSAATAL